MGINSQRDHLAKLQAARRLAQEQRDATPMFTGRTPEGVPVLEGIVNGQHSSKEPEGSASDLEPNPMYSNLHPKVAGFFDEDGNIKKYPPKPMQYQDSEQLERMTPAERAEYDALPVPFKALADLHWEAGYDMGMHIGSESADQYRDAVTPFLFSPAECEAIVNSIFFEGPIGRELAAKLSAAAEAAK